MGSRGVRLKRLIVMLVLAALTTAPTALADHDPAHSVDQGVADVEGRVAQRLAALPGQIDAAVAAILSLVERAEPDPQELQDRVEASAPGVCPMTLNYFGNTNTSRSTREVLVLASDELEERFGSRAGRTIVPIYDDVRYAGTWCKEQAERVVGDLT